MDDVGTRFPRSVRSSVSAVLLLAVVLWERRRAALEMVGLFVGAAALVTLMIVAIIVYNAATH